MTETSGDDEIDWDARLRFKIAIMVKHPSLDPDELTAALGRAPRHSRQAGQPRANVRGEPMPGVWPLSYWLATRRVEGQRHFFAAICEEVAALEAQAALLGRILAEGGEVLLTISLAGEDNIGDVMPAAMLLRLGTLGVGLGIEVFPDMA